MVVVATTAWSGSLGGCGRGGTWRGPAWKGLEHGYGRVRHAVPTGTEGAHPEPPRCVPWVWGPKLRSSDRGLGPAARRLGPRSGVVPVFLRGSVRPVLRCRLVALSRAGAGRAECARRHGCSLEQGPRTASGSSCSGRAGGPGGGLEMSCLCRLLFTYLFLALLLHAVK